ncbi:MAG: hypothetical protein IJT30_12150 [Muribaculaceae bacterium]|nr:hypothetical protein [Muribaculaceae bacterium]
MADNNYEYHAQDVAKRQARLARERQQRRNRYLAAYRNRLKHAKDDIEKPAP